MFDFFLIIFKMDTLIQSFYKKMDGLIPDDYVFTNDEIIILMNEYNRITKDHFDHCKLNDQIIEQLSNNNN